jgi:hypothetical protein
MSIVRSTFIVYLLCVGLVAVGVSAESSRVYSLSEYIAELNRLSASAKQVHENPVVAAKVISQLRGRLKVQAEGQVFEVDTSWIVDQFVRLQKGANAEVRDRLLERIEALEADAQAFQQAPSDTASVRATLDQILARGEFHQVHGPTWLDRLKLRILSWIFRLISRFFGSSSVPVVGRVLVWSLVAIAVAVLAFFVYRTITQNGIETIMPEVMPVSAKQWRVWMEEAQAAAAKGHWRDAIHLGYWAGISFLEENGMWRPDQARTPREYLRLLPASSEHRSALSTLTRQFEVIWYGKQQAGPEAFAEMFRSLESLGCRLG